MTPGDRVRNQHTSKPPLPPGSTTSEVHPDLANHTARQAVALAQAARDRGQSALTTGDTEQAARWLDRALRLAPRDPNIALSLASCVLGRDPARAEALFGRVAANGGTREAWQGLAAAHLLRGQPEQAAWALAQALSTAAIAPGTEALAAAIARSANSPGWCGISTGESGATTDLVVELHQPTQLHFRLDGRPVDGTALPPDWTSASMLDVLTDDGRPLLGSPIHPRNLRRLTGYIEAVDDGLRGWAWYPANPEASPRLFLEPSSGGAGFSIIAADTSIVVDDAGPLARPRGFAVNAKQLGANLGSWHVRSAEGQDLLGSPLTLWSMRIAHTAAAGILADISKDAAQPAQNKRKTSTCALSYTPAPIGPSPPTPPDPLIRRPVSVVIPVHNNGAVVLTCLESVLPTLPSDVTAIVVDDASSEPALREALDRLAEAARIRLIRHARNHGFPASANAGIAAADGDVVLLNSDTLVPRDWLTRLRETVYALPGIGTATPLSNEATILSYPAPGGGNPVPDQPQTEQLAALTWRTHGPRSIEIPVGVGFCLYIRRDCLDAVGMLREDVFAQGYGEENDFCLRARALGWRNVAAPGVFVAHLGGGSFGGAGRWLLRRNQGLLNRLHPGYDALIAAFARDNPLAKARRSLDLARWRAARLRGRRHETVLIITHADGGGVEQRVQAACRTHVAAGRRAIVLRPARDQDGRSCAVLDVPAGELIPTGPGQHTASVPEISGNRFPNLRFRLPAELSALMRLLRTERIAMVEMHHFLDHHPVIHQLPAMLGVPHEVHVHDYAWFCPRVALVNADRRYCGEPAPAGCETCIARGGRYISESIAVTDLINRSTRFLETARQVQTPSRDAARRMKRHFPQVRFIVTPHEVAPGQPVPRELAQRKPARPRGERARVCVAGAIGLHKGYDVLLGCAQDAAHRDLDLEFVVVGTTTDDATLLATERVFITGPYEPDEVIPLIEAQHARLGLLPSIWPETWCLALTELWRAGLDVVAFDVGAQAERIKQRGTGELVPLWLPVEEINNVLVAAICRDRDTNVC